MSDQEKDSLHLGSAAHTAAMSAAGKGSAWQLALSLFRRALHSQPLNAVPLHVREQAALAFNVALAVCQRGQIAHRILFVCFPVEMRFEGRVLWAMGIR